MITAKSFFERRGGLIARVCSLFCLSFLVVTGIQNTADIEIIPNAGTAFAAFFVAAFLIGVSHTYIYTTKAERKAKELKRWMHLRSSGRKRYVIIHGILLWSLPLALFSSFVDLSPVEITYRHESVGEAAFYFIYWTLVGILLGFWNWHSNERKLGPFEFAPSKETETAEAPI